MASGALLITDRIANGQSDLFENKTHLVEYVDDNDLIEIADFYLHSDSERDRIAGIPVANSYFSSTPTHTDAIKSLTRSFPRRVANLKLQHVICRHLQFESYMLDSIRTLA